MRSNHLKSESIIPIFCLAKLEFLDSHYHLLTEKLYITSSLGNTSLNGFSHRSAQNSKNRILPIVVAPLTIPEHCPERYVYYLCAYVCGFVTYKGTSKQHIALFCLLLSIIKRIHTMWPSGSFSFCKDPFIWGFCSSQLKTIQSPGSFLKGERKAHFQ